MGLTVPKSVETVPKSVETVPKFVNAERAQDLGFESPGWFRLPWFEPLRSDPSFRRLLGGS
jgi:hypothetical protein